LCLVSFYLLLRHVAVSPRLALLGTATLGCNPIYLYLSYSFMTDITFLACWLFAGLLFLRGFQGYGERWVWLGSAVSALAYLTRQPGVLLVVAALVYLLWSRRWTWRRAAAVAGIPLITVIAYMLWERTQPSTVLSSLLSQMIGDVLGNPIQFFASRVPFVGLLINGLGLFLLPVLRLPRRLLLAMPLFALFAVLVFLNTHFNGSAFPTNGNVLDRTGFLMWNYAAALIWAEWVWALIGICSGFILALYAVSLLEGVRESRTLARRDRQQADPTLMLYIQAVLISGFVLFVTPVLYDRYMLPILPLLMIPALRRYDRSELPGTVSSTRRRMFRWAALALLAAFSVTCLRDYMDHATVRWQAANQLAGRGIPRDEIDAGFEWQGSYWKLSGAPGEVFPSASHINYKVSDLPAEGYHMIGSLPYSSWLSGGQTRYVLLLERD
jgi:4-amino-4-deoxy-L-arabinose transferase-like glycosyltransferase